MVRPLKFQTDLEAVIRLNLADIASIFKQGLALASMFQARLMELMAETEVEAEDQDYFQKFEKKRKS